MSNEKKSRNISLYFIFAVVGIVLIVVGTVWLVQSEDFKKNAVQTEATITKIETYEDSDDETQYNVLVEFYADDVKVEGDLGFHVSGMKKGQTVKILYNPDDPNDFKSASEGIWMFVVFIIGGIPLTFVGFFPLIMKLITAIKNRRVQV